MQLVLYIACRRKIFKFFLKKIEFFSIFIEYFIVFEWVYFFFFFFQASLYNKNNHWNGLKDKPSYISQFFFIDYKNFDNNSFFR